MSFPAACHRSDTPVAKGEDPPVPLREVRVLIAAGVQKVRIRSRTPSDIRGDNIGSLDVEPGEGWFVIQPANDAGFLLGGTARDVQTVFIEPAGADPIAFCSSSGGRWSEAARYPGALRIERDADGLSVVATVDIEEYVAGVVAYEVWPTFHDEAYRAQAIAARTFVLYQMKRRNRAGFDVAATQGSQVYHGIRTDKVGRRARAATEHTRGLACTYVADGREDLFCTFYSAVCGGLSQSAALFGAQNDVPPLAGGVACDFCKIALGDTYRWGPVRMGLRELTARLVARYPDLSSLGSVVDVEVVERTSAGRPVTLQLTGSTGDSRDIMAERFRLAAGPQEIKSTDCDIEVSRGVVVFSNGRGFGHGLGLCQWGMEGQAIRGKRGGEILRFYYPGSKLTRVY